MAFLALSSPFDAAMAEPLSPTSTVEDLQEEATAERNEGTSSSTPHPLLGSTNNGAPDEQSGGNGGVSANRHYAAPKRAGTFDSMTRKRKHKNRAVTAYPDWEKAPDPRRPYHDYVHSLVDGGWDMLRDLDEYLQTDLEDARLIISVLDVAPDAQSTKRWPDIYDEADLAKFMGDRRERPSGAVRLYLAEQQGGLAAGVIEALGAGLDLDPRFFQWTLFGNRNSLSPSHRHHAQYVSIGFGVPKLDTPNRTDAESFKVTVYIRPDDVGDGWTGKFA